MKIIIALFVLLTAVPAGAVSDRTLRKEIEEYVFEPCLDYVAMRNGFDSATKAAFKEVAKATILPNTIREMIPILRPYDDFKVRKIFHNYAKEECIRGASE